MDCDLVEVSAHMGARPSHAAWQGKIYSLSGTSDKYPSFYAVCMPGEPDGIGGVNCRHSYYPYFEGMPRMYSDGELDEMKEPTIEYNGKKITQYEAEQNLRALERGIRKHKLEVDALEAAGLDATAEKQKLGAWQAKTREYCKETGIRRDYSREYVGTASGKQPIKTTSKIELTRAHAENMFPDEKWKKVNDNIFIAESRKAVNKQQKQIFDKELAMSKIAARYGHTVYMLPEKSKGKNCDVIMDGALTEFKKITGNGNALSHRFREALKQGQNVFLKIDADISATRTKEILHGVLKDKDNDGIIYCYFNKDKKMYRWKMSVLK